MHEKVEHLFAQKTQRQSKSPLPLLSPLVQILFNVYFSILIFTSKIVNNFNRSCSFSLIVTFTTFSNIFLRARILHKISDPFILEFFELSKSFDGAILS